MHEIPLHIREEIQSLYKTRSLSFTLLASITNTVYRVSKKTLPLGILKIAATDKERGLQKEYDLLPLLKKFLVPVPTILLADEKRPLQWLFMQDLGEETIMHSFVRNSQAIDTTQRFHLLGETLAKLHLLLPEPFTPLLPLFDNQPTFKAFCLNRFSHAVMTLPRSVTQVLPMQHIIPLIDEIPDDTAIALCHMDFGPWQVIIQGKKIQGIIDWERALLGNRLYDLGVTLLFSPHSEAIMAGYTKHIPFPTNYQELLTRYQLVQAFHFLQFMHERGKEDGVAYYQEKIRGLLYPRSIS